MLTSQELDVPLDVLSSIKKYKDKVFVIKYGGSIMENKLAKKTFMQDVALIRKLGINIVIVHGGGPEISKCLKKFGIESNFKQGLRVTDKKTMKIVEKVLLEKVNKEILFELSQNGVASEGISGEDDNLITAKKKYVYEEGKAIDIGYVGEVVSINTNILIDIMKDGKIPVVSPIACDEKGNKYNINADYAAAAISAELNSEKLIILTDVEGVYKDINKEKSLVHTISAEKIKEYIQGGIIKGGMIPKMECCIKAIDKGTANVHLIDGRKEHCLISYTSSDKGTKIVSKEEIKKCQRVI